MPLLHKARAAHMMFCVMALFPTSGSSQKAQKWYKRIEFITGCRASIRGALCLQSTTAGPFKSCKERKKKQHLQRYCQRKTGVYKVKSQSKNYTKEHLEGI